MPIGSLVSSLLALFLFTSSTKAAAIDERTTCFPLGGAVFSGTSKPDQNLTDWWCPADQQYGFMGFSYPLENPDCTDKSNSFDKMNTDFARMKSEFGATMVRIYAPECREDSVWRNIMMAALANNLAVMPQVWWGFGDQSLWQKTKASILAVLQDATLGPVAPYVFHSLAFGSEPIGDQVDGNNFVADLTAMKTALQPYGIPITISEDWDRPGTMSSGNLTGGLGPIGKQIASVIDLLHVHPMPYYHADRFPTAANVWPYFQQYISFLQTNLPGKPIFITETMWSSELGGGHDRGFGNPGENIGNFTQYWETLENQCQYFKTQQVGWFVHAYDDSFEEGLGMIDDNGKTKISFLPPKC
ncbi:glycoside hydrolase family 17 protein [Ramaria rubella]|nr:glycoside hydrolase family 17 protein [Ramaria rubella]